MQLMRGRKRIEKLIKDTQDKSDKIRTEVSTVSRSRDSSTDGDRLCKYRHRLNRRKDKLKLLHRSLCGYSRRWVLALHGVDIKTGGRSRYQIRKVELWPVASSLYVRHFEEVVQYQSGSTSSVWCNLCNRGFLV